MIPYELHREAEGDLLGAASYYEDRVPGLGIVFIDEFEASIQRVIDRPLSNQFWPDVPAELGIRRKILHRFPYGLPYVQPDNRLVFLAVVHLSREPGFWLRRADEYLESP